MTVPARAAPPMSAGSPPPVFRRGDPVHMSWAEWERFERTAERRHDWIGTRALGDDDAVGEVRPKEGYDPDGSRSGTEYAHAAIATDALVAVAGRVDRDRFEPLPGLALRTPAGSYYYSDLALAPRPPELERHPDGENDFVLNPLVIAEIVSPATAAVDRGEKRDAYRTVPSVTDYLLIDQDRPRVEHLRRSAAGWAETVAEGPDAAVTIAVPALTLPLADLYARVFPAP